MVALGSRLSQSPQCTSQQRWTREPKHHLLSPDLLSAYGDVLCFSTDNQEIDASVGRSSKLLFSFSMVHVSTSSFLLRTCQTRLSRFHISPVPIQVEEGVPNQPVVPNENDCLFAPGAITAPHTNKDWVPHAVFLPRHVFSFSNFFPRFFARSFPTVCSQVTPKCVVALQ